MAAAVIGFPIVSAGVYVLSLSTIWALVRLTPAGGAVGSGRALQDAGYAYVLGMAIMIILLYLRQSAAGIDRRQAEAILRYRKATTEHETEKQRMAVDALLHDNVMTTLLHVSRADSPHERLLSARMAITSLIVIADTEDHLDRHQTPVTAAEIRQRFQQIKTELGSPVALRITGPEQHHIPWVVAESLFAAALQALVNSVQHGGPAVISRAVIVLWTESHVEVEIVDDGIGFDPSAKTNRMGVRVSILERMEVIGGSAVIDSAPGHGTRVFLTWNDPAPNLLPTAEPRAVAAGVASPKREQDSSPAFTWAALSAGSLSLTVGILLLAHVAALPLAVFAALAQVTLYVILAYNANLQARPSRALCQVLLVTAGATQAIRGVAFLISPALHGSITLSIVGAAGCACAITGLTALRRRHTHTLPTSLLIVGASIGLGGFLLSALYLSPALVLGMLLLASIFEILAAAATLTPPANRLMRRR